MCQLRSKRGDLTITQIIELLLAAGAIVVLILVFVALVDMGDYSEAEKASNSYFETLKEQIAVAADDKVGEFSMWQGRNNSLPLTLVYFGDQVNTGGFSSVGNNENHICICYREATVSYPECKACTNLDFPAYYIRGNSRTNGEPFHVPSENFDNLEILTEDGIYAFYFS